MAPWGSLEVQLSHEDRINHAVAIADGCACCSLCSVRGGFERFYCGAPLVAANGHRLGTMCLGGSQPKTMDAEQVQLLPKRVQQLERPCSRLSKYQGASELAAQDHECGAGLGLQGLGLAAQDQLLLSSEDVIVHECQRCPDESAGWQPKTMSAEQVQL